MGSGAALLGRVNRAGWLRSAGLPWDRLAPGLVRPGLPWAWEHLVSPCAAAVGQEQIQASPGLSLIFNGSYRKASDDLQVCKLKTLTLIQ